MKDKKEHVARHDISKTGAWTLSVNSTSNNLLCGDKANTNGPSYTKQKVFFRFCWWNGGGKIRTRLKTNPELARLLAKKPDVFVYGEAETPSPHNLNIENYDCYLHKSKLESSDSHRRGLAIFYRTKYRFLLSKVYSSRKYDIVWMRLKTDLNAIYK